MALNIVLSAGRSVALVVALGVAGRLFAPVALGAFMLVRRVAATAACFLQLGVSQTLVRYLPLHRDDDVVKGLLVRRAVTVWVAVALPCILIAYASRGILRRWLFPGAHGDPQLAFWGIALAVATVGSFIAYSTLLAERRVVAANVVELMNASGWILLAFQFWPRATLSPTVVVGAQAVGMVGLGVIIAFIYLQSLDASRSVSHAPRWGELASYAVPRTAVSFGDMGLLLLGPWLIRTNLEEAGYLILALAIVRLLQTAVAPLAQIATVVSAQLLGRDDRGRIRLGTWLVLVSVTYATVLGMAALGPWAAPLVRIWMSEQQVAGGILKYLGVIAIGILPYLIFQALKGIVEVMWRRPRNLLTLLLGTVALVGTFIVVRPRLGSAMAAAYGVSIAFVTVGVLTLIWLRHYLRPFREFGIVRLGAAALVLWLLSTVAVGIGGAAGVTLSTAGTLGVATLLLTVFPPSAIREVRDFLIPDAR